MDTVKLQELFAEEQELGRRRTEVDNAERTKISRSMGQLRTKMLLLVMEGQEDSFVINDVDYLLGNHGVSIPKDRLRGAADRLARKGVLIRTKRLNRMVEYRFADAAQV